MSASLSSKLSLPSRRQYLPSSRTGELGVVVDGWESRLSDVAVAEKVTWSGLTVLEGEIVHFVPSAELEARYPSG